MKIAIITPVFLPYHSGMTTVAYRHALELAELGHEVIVFAPRIKGTQRQEFMDGFEVRRLSPMLSYGNGAIILGLKGGLSKFDIVHLHYPFYGTAETFLLGRLKTPIVATYHMDVIGSGLWKPFFAWHSRKIMPRILKRMERITVSSLDYIKHSNAASIFKSDPDRFMELPLGVDVDEFEPGPRPDELARTHGIEEGDPVALIVGALDRAHTFKNLDRLLEAFVVVAQREKEYFRHDGTSRLVVVGKGELMFHYQRKAEKLGIADRVVFAGGISQEALLSYYRLADVTVLPSADRSEAFGLVLAEAMACGRATIASDIPGVRSVVDRGKTGFLIDDPQDTDEIAKKLLMALSQPDRMKAFGEAGRQKVLETYDWKKIGRRLEGLYEEIVGM